MCVTHACLYGDSPPGSLLARSGGFIAAMVTVELECDALALMVVVLVAVAMEVGAQLLLLVVAVAVALVGTTASVREGWGKSSSSSRRHWAAVRQWQRAYLKASTEAWELRRRGGGKEREEGRRGNGMEGEGSSQERGTLALSLSQSSHSSPPFSFWSEEKNKMIDRYVDIR